MHTLVLLRHAKAVRAEEAADDESRRLAPRGVTEAAAAGAALREAELGITVALVSPAARTQETWAQVAPHLPGVEARTLDTLYMAEPDVLFEAALGAKADAVLIIAHNPGLQDLTRHLVDEAHERARDAQVVRSHFPTAAWAAFGLTGQTLAAPGPRFLAAWRPRD